MSESKSTEETPTTKQTPTTTETPTSPFRSLTGAVISGGLGYAMYNLMINIATNFANKPIHSHNPVTLRISSLIRTAIVGMIGLGTTVFAVVALGLLALTVQLVLEQNKKKVES